MSVIGGKVFLLRLYTLPFRFGNRPQYRSLISPRIGRQARTEAVDDWWAMRINRRSRGWLGATLAATTFILGRARAAAEFSYKFATNVPLNPR